jgi:hypothetical protein
MSQKKQILSEKSYDERVLQDFELEQGDGEVEQRIRDSVGSCLPTLVLTCCFYENTAAYGKQQTR